MQLKSVGYFIIVKFFVLFLSSTISRSEFVQKDTFALLTGTLKTYQRGGCDEDIVTLNCPVGTIIVVQFAYYGKQALAKDLCSNISVSNEAIQNETCTLPSALEKLIHTCNKKRECTIQISPKTFGGDPCPGVRKYVEVAYRCRPDEFRSKMACENEIVSLKCNSTYRIAIYSATYGRTEYDSTRCPQNQGVSTKNCLVSHATDTVMQLCHGKRECIISADSASFGSQCDPQSRMYLRVIFTCVPRNILRDQYTTPLEEDEIPTWQTETLLGYGTKTSVPTRPTANTNKIYRTLPTASIADTNYNNRPARPSTTSYSYTTKPIYSKDARQSAKEMQRDDIYPTKNKIKNHTCTGDCVKENDKIIIYINEWVNISTFLLQHQSRLYLAILLSMSVGLILCLGFIVKKIIYQRRKKKKLMKEQKFQTPSIIGFSENILELDTDQYSPVPDCISSIVVRPPAHLTNIEELQNYETLCLNTTNHKRRSESDAAAPLSLTRNEYNQYYYE